MSRIVSDIVFCENQIHQFFLNQKIGNLLKRSNLDKEKGISPVALFRVLFTLVFTGKSLYRTLEAGGNCGMAKNTVYRCHRAPRRRDSLPKDRDHQILAVITFSKKRAPVKPSIRRELKP